jgi:hypothetical protein
MSPIPPVSYVLPILRQDDTGMDELTDYLRWLSERVDLIVVDGSTPELFDQAHLAWSGVATHIRPRGRSLNGKVDGVHRGIEAARHERVVLADDDVRYDDAGLEAMAAALSHADAVRPQNYFEPLPWHAAWDTARTLMNRCFGSDSPGTLGVRRSFFMAMGGYDGDVLYENLELIRTVRAAGGKVADRPDLYIRRLPPSVRRFWSQRPRQAYDDFVQPLKLLGFATIVPALAGARRRRALLSACVAVVSVALAERGRRHHSGAGRFPPHTSLWAPVWVAERSITIWIAIVMRLTGGARYGGRRIRVPAHSVRELSRLQSGSSDLAGVAAVAEGRQPRSPAPA